MSHDANLHFQTLVPSLKRSLIRRSLRLSLGKLTST